MLTATGITGTFDIVTSPQIRGYHIICFTGFDLTKQTSAANLAAKSEGVKIYQPRFAASPKVIEVDLELVVVFTRRAQDIENYYTNPKGGKLQLRRLRFA